MSAFVAVTLCSCGGSDEDSVPTPPTPPGPDEPSVSVSTIAGEWQLTGWSEGTVIDDTHTAYLELNTDKTFSLYQVRINNAGTVLYTGTFNLDEAQALISGRYSDNVAWGATYQVTLSGNSMIWQVSGKSERSTFTKKSIPADVIASARPADEVRSLDEVIRLL